MPLVEPGRKAPAFSLPDQEGRTHRLKDYAGRALIVYFYPKDDTPGCTKEACAFRDALPDFKKDKAAVVGVSVLERRARPSSPASTSSTSRCSPIRTTRWPTASERGRRRAFTGARTWGSRG